MWHLPNPPVLDTRLHADGSSLRELLEDVEMELRALLSKTAAQTGLTDPAASEGWPSADHDVERTLAAQGCESPHNPELRVCCCCCGVFTS